MMKAKKDLENVCQEIWNAAGNNLNIPTELKVNLDETNTQPLFKVELAGQAKLDSEVFTTFAGNSFSLEGHQSVYNRVH